MAGKIANESRDGGRFVCGIGSTTGLLELGAELEIGVRTEAFVPWWRLTLK